MASAWNAISLTQSTHVAPQISPSPPSPSASRTVSSLATPPTPTRPTGAFANWPTSSRRWPMSSWRSASSVKHSPRNNSTRSMWWRGQWWVGDGHGRIRVNIRLVWLSCFFDEKWLNNQTQVAYPKWAKIIVFKAFESFGVCELNRIESSDHSSRSLIDIVFLCVTTYGDSVPNCSFVSSSSYRRAYWLHTLRSLAPVQSVQAIRARLQGLVGHVQFHVRRNGRDRQSRAHCQGWDARYRHCGAVIGAAWLFEGGVNQIEGHKQPVWGDTQINFESIFIINK